MYRPWQLADITGLRNELPALPNGGGPWIERLKGVTQGIVLSVGGIPASLRACIGPLVLQRVEGIAGNAPIGSPAPPGGHAEASFDAMCTLYPVRTEALAGFSYPWKGDGTTTPEAWMHGAIEQRVAMTGALPEDGSPAVIMLKEKLLCNVPTPVRMRVTENPLVSGHGPSGHTTLTHKHAQKQQHQVAAASGAIATHSDSTGAGKEGCKEKDTGSDFLPLEMPRWPGRDHGQTLPVFRGGRKPGLVPGGHRKHQFHHFQTGRPNTGVAIDPTSHCARGTTNAGTSLPV